MRQVINPATGEVFDYVPHGTREDLDRAVDAAAEAFKTWSVTPFEERAACLMKFSALVEAKADQLARAMTMEQGKPLSNSLAEVMGICSKCKEFVEIGDLKSVTVSEDKDAEYKIVYSPRGVIGGITPWNVRSLHHFCVSRQPAVCNCGLRVPPAWQFPIGMAANKLLPSVITGNTVVVKPSPYTPLATVMLAEMAAKAFPPGVMNIMTGGDELGQMMVEHPKIAQISFTGSAATGKKIMATGAATLKKVTLELGGNDPAVVLPDVEVKDVAPQIFARAMANTGQVCVAIKRVFVHESKYEEMAAAMAVEAANARAVMNDGLLPDTKFGPINNRMQLARVEGLVEDAKANGARVIAGGNRFNPNGKQVRTAVCLCCSPVLLVAAVVFITLYWRACQGFFYEPTILADVQEGVRIVDEEQFGPVMPLIKYTDVEDAMARANDTDFGLGASVCKINRHHRSSLAVLCRCHCKLFSSYYSSLLTS